MDEDLVLLYRNVGIYDDIRRGLNSCLDKADPDHDFIYG